MKLRYLLCSIPSLSMAADAPLNFANAFGTLFAEQASETAQAVTDTDAVKTAANMLTPEKIQSQHNDIFAGEFTIRDQLQSDAEAEFTNIAKFFYADHSVLSLPNEYLGSVKNFLAGEASARLALTDTFSAEKQAIQDRLDKMDMQEVVLCDGSTLNVRKSVLEDIPFMKNLMSFDGADMADGKIMLEDNINPRLFKRLVAFLTHRQSGVMTEVPELFQPEPECIGYLKSYTLTKNQEFLSLLHYLGVDSLKDEIKEFGKSINLYSRFSCQKLCQLARIPEPIWKTLWKAAQDRAPTSLRVDFSDNLPYLSGAVNASIQYFNAMDVKIEANVNFENLGTYESRISRIKKLLSSTLIPDSVKINMLGNLPVLRTAERRMNITMRDSEHNEYVHLKEKVQGSQFVSDLLKEKMIAVIDEILTKMEVHPMIRTITSLK